MRRQAGSDFIRYVKGSKFFENTLLVVSSDHLAMRNTASKLLETGERRNLWMVFDESAGSGKITGKGSTLDIAPTVLNLMGGSVNVEGFGFGRDMLKAHPRYLNQKNRLTNYLPGVAATCLLYGNSLQISDGFLVDLERSNWLLGIDTSNFQCYLYWIKP